MAMDQADFDIRCEWGVHGVAELAPCSDAVVIVDVLSFSTCVDIATACGAAVYPYRWRDASAREFAASLHAELADADRSGRYSLSPVSLTSIAPNTRLVLPSPNGATLTLTTGSTPTFAGCLRNAAAVARACERIGRHVAIVPAGEQWPDGSLRPCFEDWIAAGAIINGMQGSGSPEAVAAVAAYRAAESEIASRLMQCGSGKELIERGFAEDVRLAARVDVSECVPVLRDGAYVNGAP